VIYLDSSALVKLIFEESESEGLAAWLLARSAVPKISSELSRIELVRTCRRHFEDTVSAARQLLMGLDLLPMAPDVVEQASVLDPGELRTLDALHLASALVVREALTAFVAYDLRLITAGELAGLPVESPA
jgi:predicted nucleic acid-binding protein